MIIPIILSGGVGSRLWPLSRGDNPKQFLRLNGQHSLLQETVLRTQDRTLDRAIYDRETNSGASHNQTANDQTASNQTTQNPPTFDRPIIVCQERHKFKVAGELEEIGVEPLALILEPCSRNTAPAIAAAAFFVAQKFGGDRTMLILPSDHVIDDRDGFVECVSRCQPFARERLITFGITPTEAATGYGYIKAGEVLARFEPASSSEVPPYWVASPPRGLAMTELGATTLQEPTALVVTSPGSIPSVIASPLGGKATQYGGTAKRFVCTDHSSRPDHGNNMTAGLYQIENFTEKPNAHRAQTFLQAGGYFWNAGIFLFSAGLYLSELKTLQPEIFAAASQAVAEAENISHDFVRLDAESFAVAEDLSVDYAILEKTSRAAVCPMQIAWTDLGSWQSLYSYLQPSADTSGNVTVGQHVLCFSSHDNLLHAQNDIHLVVNKVDNLVVVCTQDAVFIADRRHAEDTKLVYKHLETTKAGVTSNTNKSYRPWGYYEVILREANYCVKRISVLPFQQLSLQYHNHRNEHWVITKGSAVVTKGKQTIHLKTNESIYISVGEAHNIANRTAEPLEFVEVQTGELLSEDDIVRLEDKYGRVAATAKAKN